jgi:hypothetical protein
MIYVREGVDEEVDVSKFFSDSDDGDNDLEENTQEEAQKRA